MRKIVAIDKDGTFTLPEEMMVALGLKVGDTLNIKSDEKNKYSVVDEETSEVITHITEDELFEVVTKRVLNKHIEAFKKLAE